MTYITKKYYPITLDYNVPYPEEIAKILKVKRHQGVDIATPRWVRLFSPVNGKISGFGKAQWIGNYIFIDFESMDRLWKVFFFHCGGFPTDIKCGKVRKEDLVAFSGDTGYVTGAHTHVGLTMLLKGKWVFRDPNMFNFIRREENELKPNVK